MYDTRYMIKDRHHCRASKRFMNIKLIFLKSREVYNKILINFKEAAFTCGIILNPKVIAV